MAVLKCHCISTAARPPTCCVYFRYPSNRRWGRTEEICLRILPLHLVLQSQRQGTKENPLKKNSESLWSLLLLKRCVIMHFLPVNHNGRGGGILIVDSCLFPLIYFIFVQQKHKETKHLPSQPIACEFCFKVSSNIHALNKHKQRFHRWGLSWVLRFY